jgi:hypothetical protein
MIRAVGRCGEHIFHIGSSLTCWRREIFYAGSVKEEAI